MSYCCATRRWFDFGEFKPEAYLAMPYRLLDDATLGIYPLDVGAAAFRKGVASGGRFEYRIGPIAAAQRKDESEQEFLMRCAADGKYPDFMETSAGGATDIIDMSTGESLMEARRKAIERAGRA